jgi:hypothetical protein
LSTKLLSNQENYLLNDTVMLLLSGICLRN